MTDWSGGLSVPTILTGDFNAPAFTDWTEKTVGTRPFMRYPLEWPVSRAVVAASRVLSGFARPATMSAGLPFASDAPAPSCSRRKSTPCAALIDRFSRGTSPSGRST